MQKAILPFYLIAMVLFQGCGLHTYVPPLYHIPVNEKKHDINISGSTGIENYNGNISYSISNKLGVSFVANSNYFKNKPDTSFRRNEFELSGYFHRNKKDAAPDYGIIAGAGIGNCSAHNYKVPDFYEKREEYFNYVKVNSRYNSFYIAPFYTYKRPRSPFGFTCAFRVSYIYFSKYSSREVFHSATLNNGYTNNSLSVIVYEPTFRITIGRRLKFLWQICAPTLYPVVIADSHRGENIVDSPGISIQAGMIFRVFPFKLKE